MKVKCRIGQYTPDQHFKQMVTSILPINSKKDETLTRKKQTDGNPCLSKQNKSHYVLLWILNHQQCHLQVHNRISSSSFLLYSGNNKAILILRASKIVFFFKEQEIILKYVTCFDKHRGAIRVTFWQTRNYLYTQYPKVTKKVHAAKISHKDVVPFQHKSPKQIPQCYQLRLSRLKL